MSDRLTIRAFLSRLRRACSHHTVVIDSDTQQEAEDLGFGPTDIENILFNLEIDDLYKKVPCKRYPGHDVWVFTPCIDEQLTLWIRIVELSGILVFSFHHRDRDED